MGEGKKSISARAARMMGALAIGSLAAVSVSGIGGERVGFAADATLERLLWEVGAGARRTPPKPIGERRAKSAARRRRLRGQG